MRQLGWLHAVPEAAADKQAKDSKPDRRTRMKRFADMGIAAPLPEVAVGGRLLDWLFQIGPLVAGGAGYAPITHSEMAAWQFNCRVRITPWESFMLRRLSQEYLAALQSSEDPMCPPPYEYEEFIAVRAAHAAKDLRAEMRALLQ